MIELPADFGLDAERGETLVITETTISDSTAGNQGGESGSHLLIMFPGEFVSHRLPASGVVSIGRSSKCQVQIEDPLASREHARLHIEGVGPTQTLTIEDTGSANGTRVRAAALAPGQQVPILPGEPITIGSAVLMVMKDRPMVSSRRLWSHSYFERRVEDECERAAKGKGVFAFVRLQFMDAPWVKVLPLLAEALPPPQVFASYGPQDYEILLVDVSEGEADRLLSSLMETLRGAGFESRAALAWYPRNGRTGDALLASANALLKVPPARSTNVEPSPVEISSMQRVRTMAARAASSSINVNVLVLGETGVGKEVLAHLVHELSPRARKPFVALNCSGLSETLLESELFGHERGAFTGAATAKVGLLESANGGTVFLDEIGEMSLVAQAKLLRVIETRTVLPVGSVRPRPIDVRFVSATNRDLEAAIVKGEFRPDLMFRLNGLSLLVPPLRERRDEIPLLVETFINDACREGSRVPPTVGSETLAHFLNYRWPGNIRELKNVVERALILCDGPEILPQHLPLDKMGMASRSYVVSRPAAPTPPQFRVVPLDVESAPREPTKVSERQRIIDALAACGGNQTRAAKSLRISRRTLVSKLTLHEIPRPQKDSRVNRASRRVGSEDAG